jgi:hypothetical protein
MAEALAVAGRTRLRPVFMTSLTAYACPAVPRRRPLPGGSRWTPRRWRSR